MVLKGGYRKPKNGKFKIRYKGYQVRVRCRFCDKLKWYPSEITQEIIFPKKKKYTHKSLKVGWVCRKCRFEKTGRWK